MNAIASIPKPCRTVKEWLARHKVTRCPSAHALGLSEIEALTGLVANEGLPWRDAIRRENEAGKRKRLQSSKKSANRK